MSNQLSYPGAPIECSHFKEMALSSENTPLGSRRFIFQRGSANIYNFKLSKVTALQGVIGTSLLITKFGLEQTVNSCNI